VQKRNAADELLWEVNLTVAWTLISLETHINGEVIVGGQGDFGNGRFARIAADGELLQVAQLGVFSNGELDTFSTGGSPNRSYVPADRARFTIRMASY